MNNIYRSLSVITLAGAILLCSCSTNLGPETLPSTTPTTVETEPEPTETVETTFPEATEPSSKPVVTEKIVEKHGKLSIDGKNLVDSEGETVILKGISTYGIQDCGDFFTAEVVKTLAEDWGCDILRISLTGDKDSGYLKDADKNFDTICKLCDMCTEQGIYVLIDWDVLYADEADENKDAAVDFFKRISAIYSDSPNILYEVSNAQIPVTAAAETDEEPEEVDDWGNNIKPFAEEVIEALRENSPDSIIIVDVSDNGIGIDAAVDSDLDYDNIAYGCKFYSGSQGQELRDKIKDAADDDYCVFITGWGLCNDRGLGGVYYTESGKWAEFFDEYEISWCNYAIGSSVKDDANALKLDSERYTDEQKYSGHWPDGLLSKSGAYAKEQLLKVPAEPLTEDTEE